MGGADRQPMLEIPGREAALGGVEAQPDLALIERLAIGFPEDRQQHPSGSPVGVSLPVDVEGRRMGRFRSPFQDVEPPGIVGVVTPIWLGTKSRMRPMPACARAAVSRANAGVAAEFGIERIVDRPRRSHGCCRRGP